MNTSTMSYLLYCDLGTDELAKTTTSTQHEDAIDTSNISPHKPSYVVWYYEAENDDDMD